MKYIVHSHFTAPKGPKTQTFTLPSETVPEQGLTVQEIIARFVRTGVMPVATHSDEGGNDAFEPGLDPLDLQPDQVKAMMNKPEESAKPASEKAPEEPSTEAESNTNAPA